MVRLYLLPGLGEGTKLAEVKPDRVQDLYNHLISDGVGISMVRYVHVVLRIALSHAVKLQLIQTNPTDAVITPAEPKWEMESFDEAQANQMLFAARGHRLEALFYLAVTTGMRQSELLGLRWTDLDWIRRTLRIERQLARGTEGYQLVELKTMYSRRTIELGEVAIAKLRERQVLERLERAVAGDRWAESQLIFPSTIGTPQDHRGLGRQFKQLLRNADLPEIRFHDLRHTAASLMLNHGVPVITASRILGHSRPSITMDMYGHLLPGQQGEVAALMDRLVASVEVQLSAPPDPTAT
jgi:integrase